MSYIKGEKRLFSAFSDFYNKMTEGSESKFNGKAELFVVALVLGFYHNKRNNDTKAFHFGQYSVFGDKKRSDLRAIIEMIYGTASKGKDENAKWLDVLRLADGGIEYLKEHYDKTGDNIDASILIKDVEKLLDSKVKQISSWMRFND